jgi:hypothetical protein
MADYRSENAASLQRLFALLDSLDADKLAHRLPNGWTVADALTHLAFWDAYALSWLRSWQKGETLDDSTNIGTINAAVTVLSHSIPPEAAVQLMRQAAEAVDHEVESLDQSLAAAIETSGKKHLLFRAWHRNEHLQVIERELA